MPNSCKNAGDNAVWISLNGLPEWAFPSIKSRISRCGSTLITLIESDKEFSAFACG